jgi:hypothetical protein
MVAAPRLPGIGTGDWLSDHAPELFELGRDRGNVQLPPERIADQAAIVRLLRHGLVLAVPEWVPYTCGRPIAC